MVHNKTAKFNIPMCLACILFCLTLISVYITSGLYAKYTVKNGVGDSARVIRFGELTITESGDFGDGSQGVIIPGVDLTKKAVVAFAGSEASTYIFIKITLCSDWTTDGTNFTVTVGNKTQMQWKIGDDWKYLNTDGNGTYIYYRELAPNTPLSADIIADDGRISVSDKITNKEIVGMNDIFIRLSAAAVQSNGFSDAAAAWESITSKEG